MVVRDLKTAESVFEKAKDKEVAFSVVRESLWKTAKVMDG